MNEYIERLEKHFFIENGFLLRFSYITPSRRRAFLYFSTKFEGFHDDSFGVFL